MIYDFTHSAVSLRYILLTNAKFLVAFIKFVIDGNRKLDLTLGDNIRALLSEHLQDLCTGVIFKSDSKLFR